MTTISIPSEVAEAGLGAERIYLESIENGCAESMAIMFALRSPPRSNTDRELFQGQGTLLDQFDGDERECARVVFMAKKNGYVPGVNDVYIPSLANNVGDPEAFVPATGGKSHIKKVIEKRGWQCDGAVKVKKPMYREPAPDKLLGEDIIQRKVAEAVAKNPDLRHASPAKKADLREKIIDRHSFNKK